MAEEEKKKSFWETLPGIITAIGAFLGGVAAVIAALNGGNKEGSTRTETAPPVQARSVAQPSSTLSGNDEAARQAKAEAEAELERAKTEAAEAKARAAELERKLADVERKIAIETVKAEQQAAAAAKEVERLKAKVREKELAESANGSSKEFMAMLKGNEEAAKKFLDENKDKEGVKTTASGLQYKVIKKGSGPNPIKTDTVKVHYRGTLLDGTEFDNSYKRNEPARFKLDNVISGWFEALQLMNVGSIFELYIPPELAYGDRGAAPAIQPGSLLKFEVELLDIVEE